MRRPAPQDPVALGMTAYVRGRFRLRVFGREHVRIEPGQIFAPSHRSDNDVPVLITVLYPAWAQAVARGASWPTFGAMIELFLPGFFAGYPAGLPLALRRLLWPHQPGAVLERYLQCIPVREPGRMRLQELLRHNPDERLEDVLPAALLDALGARSAAVGRRRPARAGEVLDGAYADLLWIEVERAAMPDPSAAWETHARAAVQEVRRLGATVAGGASVIMFPEGDLSADGEIGPLQPGLGSLARRGRVRRVQPVALAYDPLVPGRTRAYVSFTEALEPAPGRLVADVDRTLRAATPLTPGQLAAGAVLAGDASAPSFARSAGEAIARARAEGRPVEPALLRGPAERGRALRWALARARRRGADDPLVRRLAREIESARGA
jgi:1-acyl-sn-glycerol-3-phosphate acyltransferase